MSSVSDFLCTRIPKWSTWIQNDVRLDETLLDGLVRHLYQEKLIPDDLIQKVQSLKDCRDPIIQKTKERARLLFEIKTSLPEKEHRLKTSLLQYIGARGLAVRKLYTVTPVKVEAPVKVATPAKVQKAASNKSAKKCLLSSTVVSTALVGMAVLFGGANLPQRPNCTPRPPSNHNALINAGVLHSQSRLQMDANSGLFQVAKPSMFKLTQTTRGMSPFIQDAAAAPNDASAVVQTRTAAPKMVQNPAQSSVFLTQRSQNSSMVQMDQPTCSLKDKREMSPAVQNAAPSIASLTQPLENLSGNPLFGPEPYSVQADGLMSAGILHSNSGAFEVANPSMFEIPQPTCSLGGDRGMCPVVQDAAPSKALAIGQPSTLASEAFPMSAPIQPLNFGFQGGLTTAMNSQSEGLRQHLLAKSKQFQVANPSMFRLPQTARGMSPFIQDAAPNDASAVVQTRTAAPQMVQNSAPSVASLNQPSENLLFGPEPYSVQAGGLMSAGILHSNSGAFEVANPSMFEIPQPTCSLGGDREMCPVVQDAAPSKTLAIGQPSTLASEAFPMSAPIQPLNFGFQGGLTTAMNSQSEGLRKHLLANSKQFQVANPSMFRLTQQTARGMSPFIQDAAPNDASAVVQTRTAAPQMVQNLAPSIASLTQPSENLSGNPLFGPEPYSVQADGLMNAGVLHSNSGAFQVANPSMFEIPQPTCSLGGDRGMCPVVQDAAPSKALAIGQPSTLASEAFPMSAPIQPLNFGFQGGLTTAMNSQSEGLRKHLLANSKQFQVANPSMFRLTQTARGMSPFIQDAAPNDASAVVQTRTAAPQMVQNPAPSVASLNQPSENPLFGPEPYSVQADGLISAGILYSNSGAFEVANPSMFEIPQPTCSLGGDRGMCPVVQDAAPGRGSIESQSLQGFNPKFVEGLSEAMKSQYERKAIRPEKGPVVVEQDSAATANPPTQKTNPPSAAVPERDVPVYSGNLDGYSRQIEERSQNFLREKEELQKAARVTEYHKDSHGDSCLVNKATLIKAKVTGKEFFCKSPVSNRIFARSSNTIYYRDLDGRECFLSAKLVEQFQQAKAKLLCPRFGE